MIATIVNNHWLQLEHVPGDAESLLINFFSVRHPKAQFIDVEQQSWDGWYRKYDSKRQRLARPLLHELMRFAEENEIPLEIYDARDPVDSIDPERVTLDFIYGITLQDHQVRAIRSVCDHEIGLHHHTTGAGKTEIMAGITKLLDKPTIIIAEQRVVIEQIKERLELRNIVEEVGLFYGGEMPTGQTVVVGSIQSFSSPPVSLRQKNPIQYKKRYENSNKFQELVENAEVLLVDECDRATNKMYRKLFKCFKGRYRYGFSGTPFDSKKPVEALVLKEHLGSVISLSTRDELEKIGRIIPIHYVAIAIGEDGDRNDRTAFDIAERELIVDNTEFHARVARIVNAFPEDGTLILVDTNNIADLGHALERLIPGSKFIYNKTSKSERRKYVGMFERREIRCLIGGRILKRGLDLKGGIENLILCGGGKLESDFDQKIGRSVRNNKRKWARAFGFFFLNNYYLYRHSREQLKFVVNMGYRTTVLINGDQLDGQKFVSSRFRLPKAQTTR